MLPDRDEGAFRGRPAMAEAVTTAAEVPPVASPLVRNTAPPQESMAAPSARVISLLVLAVLGPSVTLKSSPIPEAVNSPLRSASTHALDDVHPPPSPRPVAPSSPSSPVVDPPAMGQVPMCRNPR